MTRGSNGFKHERVNSGRAPSVCNHRSCLWNSKYLSWIRSGLCIKKLKITSAGSRVEVLTCSRSPGPFSTSYLKRIWCSPAWVWRLGPSPPSWPTAAISERGERSLQSSEIFLKGFRRMTQRTGSHRQLPALSASWSKSKVALEKYSWSCKQRKASLSGEAPNGSEDHRFCQIVDSWA